MEPPHREPTPLRRANDGNKSSDNLPGLKHSKSAMLNEVKLFVQYWGMPLTEEARLHEINQIDIENDKIFEIYTGESHLFILTRSKHIYGFGDNRFNQIDASNATRANNPAPLEFGPRISVNKIFCGCDYTFCLANKNDVFAWGLNFKGQLGLGHTEPVRSPTLVRALSMEGLAVSRGSPEAYTDGLLAEGEFITDIVCGSLHTMALSSRSRIFSCGFGETFALGHGTNSNSHVFREMTYFAEAFQGKRIIIDKIECGVSHSACLIARKVFVWGMYGRDPSQLAKKPVMLPLSFDAGDFFTGDLLTVILTTVGDVYTLGDNIDGQLGHRSAGLAKVALPYKIEYLTGGLNHVFAVNFSKGKIFAWGSNKLGQVNPGSLEESFGEPREMTWLYQISSFAITCKGNSTFYVTKSPIQLVKDSAPNGDVNGSNVEELTEESRKLKNELENVSRRNVLLAKENDKLKEDLDRLALLVSENGHLEQSKHADSQDSNAEINDSRLSSHNAVQKAAQQRQGAQAGLRDRLQGAGDPQACRGGRLRGDL